MNTKARLVSKIMVFFTMGTLKLWRPFPRRLGGKYILLEGYCKVGKCKANRFKLIEERILRVQILKNSIELGSLRIQSVSKPISWNY